MPWNTTDAVKFREYLSNNRNSLLIHLMEVIPPLEIGVDAKIEGVALSGAYKEGFMKAIETMKNMAAVQNRPDDASSGTYTAM
jgi:hypothetical protein